MHFAFASALLAANLAGPALAATGILLPLYSYPSKVDGDGAANWKPAIAAAKSDPNNQWLAVVNPHNGPGTTYEPGNQDANYIDGVGQLNALSNVNTIGYVRTEWGNASMEALKKNITAWANWSSFKERDLGVKGIFFDETVPGAEYLKEAITHAKTAFGSSCTTICNFGTQTGAEYYDICDIIIAFESCLNCADEPGNPPAYRSEETIAANIPAGREGNASILVHTFSGKDAEGKPADATLLGELMKTIVTKNVGWAFFGSGSGAGAYNDIDIKPATMDVLAQSLKNAA